MNLFSESTKAEHQAEAEGSAFLIAAYRKGAGAADMRQLCHNIKIMRNLVLPFCYHYGSMAELESPKYSIDFTVSGPINSSVSIFSFSGISLSKVTVYWKGP